MWFWTPNYSCHSRVFVLCQNPNAHPRPVSQDLAGFWDMLQLSIENISLKFDELHQLKANHWKPLTPPEIQVQLRIPSETIMFISLHDILLFFCSLERRRRMHTCVVRCHVACLTSLVFVFCLVLFLFCLVDSELSLRSHSTCHAPLEPAHLQWSNLPHAKGRRRALLPRTNGRRHETLL